MGAPQSARHADPAVLAIERVLAAERDGEARLAECRREAKSSVAAARERAAAIMRRADARISMLHTAYLLKISGRVANLDVPGAPAGLAATDDRGLAEAARRLAAKLTGAA